MLYSRDEETIIAQCTPRGSGALALLRFSGANAIEVVGLMSTLPQAKKLAEQATHTIHFGYVVDEQGAHLDQVIFLLMRGPHTFTGQDTVEITCHNNQFLIESLIQRAIACGARLAQEGEFSRRAYANGKIDLIQAEAIDELIHANSEFALKKSLAQVEGSFSHWVHTLEKKLIKAAAWCEASFEFLDEGGDFVVEITQQLQDLLTQVQQLQHSFNAQQQIRNGIRIACIGSVNVGKSSLFNALLGQNRAIVADVAGTTRDSIEAGVYRNGVYWTFIDTAGLRQTADSIEQAGIERSHTEAQLADVIILAYDGSRTLTAQEQEVYASLVQAYEQKIIFVQTKADLTTASSFDSAQDEREVGKNEGESIHHERADVYDVSLPNKLENSESSEMFDSQEAEIFDLQDIVDFSPAHPERSRRIKRIHVSVKTKQGLEQLQNALDAKVAALLQTHQAPFLVNKRQVNLLQKLEVHILATLTLCTHAAQYELISYHLKDMLEQLSELTGRSVSEAALDAVFKEFCVGK